MLMCRSQAGNIENITFFVLQTNVEAFSKWIITVAEKKPFIYMNVCFLFFFFYTTLSLSVFHYLNPI